MELLEFCRAIRLSESMTVRVLSAAEEISLSGMADAVSGLYDPQRWSQALEQVGALLEPDPDGVKKLTVSLLCCQKTLEFYREKQIPREIFIDTMAIFSRFVGEHQVSYGREGFGRWWWTVRQLSGLLFRIGTLEYELPATSGGEIRVHIPSDAVLTVESLRSSYDQARALIARAFPEHAGAKMSCESWLLSPQLKDFLSEDSRILLFQQGFTLTGTFPSDDIRQWVFKNPDLPTDALPENTSLQRKLKAFLLGGGVFRNGEGILLTSPWEHIV